MTSNGVPPLNYAGPGARRSPRRLSLITVGWFAASFASASSLSLALIEVLQPRTGHHVPGPGFDGQTSQELLAMIWVAVTWLVYIPAIATSMANGLLTTFDRQRPNTERRHGDFILLIGLFAISFPWVISYLHSLFLF